MGTTADKLSYLNTTKAQIKESINLTNINITNEPFRYYAYAIKKGIINVLNNPKEIWNNFEKVTGEGASIELTSTENAPMEINLKGNTSQAGVPTPTDPVEINVVSGDNTIEICGKNLFDKDITPENYVYNASGVKESTNDPCINQEVNINFDSIYISFASKTGTPYVRVCEYNSSGTFIKRTLVSANQALTLDSNTRKLIFSVNASSTNNFTDLMIELGSTATTYEAYKGQSQLISLGDIELCKIGDYQDEFFKNTTDSEYYDSTLELDKWYLKKRIGKAVLDGSENWNYNSGNKGFLINNNQPTFSLRNYNVYDGYCDYFSVNKNSTTWVATNYCGWNSTNTFWVKDNNEIATNADDFKTWLSTHNTDVYYVLATPENILLNDTLQETLDSFYSMQGQTNISQSNNDLPFILDVKALKLIE